MFFSFIGGKSRRVLDAGELGVHQFHGGSEYADDVQTVTQYLTSELIEYTSSMGVSIETMTIALRTTHHDMYIFSQAELWSFGLITGKPLDYNRSQKQEEPLMLVDTGIFWQQDGWIVKMENLSNGWACAMDKYTEKNKGLFGLTAKRSDPNILMIYVNGDEFWSRFIKGRKKKIWGCPR